MSKYAFAAAAALSALIASSAAMAGSTDGTGFDVTITITAGCNIDTDLTAVDWGSVQGTAKKPDAIKRPVKVTCTNGSTYGFHLTSNPTSNYSGSSFNMLNQTDKTTLLPYTVSIGAADATPLTNSAPVSLPYSSTGDQASYDFYFNLKNFGPTLALGQYKDTLTLHVDY